MEEAITKIQGLLGTINAACWIKDVSLRQMTLSRSAWLIGLQLEMAQRHLRMGATCSDRCCREQRGVERGSYMLRDTALAQSDDPRQRQP